MKKLAKKKISALQILVGFVVGYPIGLVIGNAIRIWINS